MTIGVLLSGCGVYDGAEIQEAVLTLLEIERMGAEAICIGINALWSLWFPTGLWINAAGIVVAVGLSLAAGALLYRLVETRNNALGLNARTGCLVAAVALTLVLERSI